MKAKRLNPTHAEICTRVREFQDATRVEMTDDEVKAILCRGMSIDPPVEWEALVVALCIEALERRTTSAPAPEDE